MKQSNIQEFLELNLEQPPSQVKQIILGSGSTIPMASMPESVSAFDSQFDQTQLSLQDLTNTQTLDVMNNQNNDGGINSNKLSDLDESNANSEVQETGLMGQLVKGSILRGSAYNGFDSNLDFKVLGEFKSPSTFKSVYESRTYFFTRLLETMFKQLESRTNKNTSFSLIYIYFRFAYQHNIYLSITTLIKLSKALKRSSFQKMTFSVSEYYILELILNEFKKNSKDEVNYSTFIYSNQVQQKLDWLFEDSTGDIIQFWNIFKEEQANVQKAYKLAMTISANIQTIRNYITELEYKSMIKDYNKYYYYAMFYQNILNDRQGYNQMIGNLKTLIMVRNIKRKIKGSIDDINDLGFSIISFEDQKVVGKFKYCNKIACQFLRISEEEIIDKSVCHIMPETIRMNHEQFYKRFLIEGRPRLMGRVRTLFIKDFLEYVQPVQFYLNFHFSSQFQYSMIMHIDPITQFQIIPNTPTVPMKYCMVFLCDAQNIILNLSSNVKKIIGLNKKLKKEMEEMQGRQLKMEDVMLQMLRLEQQIEQNNITYLNNQLMKIRNFRDTKDTTYITCSITYEQIIYLKGTSGQFSEKVYMIIPSSKIPEIDNGTIPVGNSLTQIQSNAYSSMDQNLLVQNSDAESQLAEFIQKEEKGGFLSGFSGMSGSASSHSRTSSSMASSSTTSMYSKDLLFNKKGPKILSLYLYIVLGVFLSFIAVSSIDFIIYIQKKNHINLEIQFNLLINQRNTYLAATLLNLKQLHLISLNKTYNNKSNIFSEGRIEYYSKTIKDNQDKLLECHNQFKQLESQYAELGVNNEQQILNVQYYLIGLNGQTYVENKTLDYGISLLISKLGQIDTKQFMNQTIPLNIDKMTNQLTTQTNKDSPYKITELQSSLYFIYKNGLTSINSLSAKYGKLVSQNTNKTSDENKLFMNLISFISIGIITLIGIFTFPLLGKIEDRKISVLKFFNLLTLEQIQELIKKGQEFQKEFLSLSKGLTNQNHDQRRDQQQDEEDDNNNELQQLDQYDKHSPSNSGSNYGAKKQIRVEEVKDDAKQFTFDCKIPNGTPKNKSQLNQDLDFPTEDNANYLDYKTKKGDSPKKLKPIRAKQSEKQFTSINEIQTILKKIQKNETNQRKKGNSKVVKIKGQSESSASLGDAFTSGGGGQKDKNKQKSLVQKIEEEIKENYIKTNKRSNNYKIQEENEDDVDNDDHNQNEKKSMKDSKQKKRREDASLEDITLPKKRNKYNNDKTVAIGSRITQRSEYIQEQLGKVAMKQKLKLAFVVIIILIFLNSCLFACYYIGQKTFKDDQETMAKLSTFYHRENCLDNLLLYTLELFISNSTIGNFFDNKTAVTFYDDFFESTESDYNDIRRGLPAFLGDVGEDLGNIENSNVCLQAYSRNGAKIAQCEQVYDQIMKRGLTQTLFLIFTYTSTLFVRFQKELRTQSFLNDRIGDLKFRDIVDLTNYYIHDIFSYMEDLVTTNAILYFDELATNYMIIYVSYMGVSIILAFVFGFFVFKKLRQQIMTSTNIIAIIPLEDLDSKDRSKIESFLNS